jgi:hypothetical protein
MSLSQYFHEINSVAAQSGKTLIWPEEHILEWVDAEVNNRVSPLHIIIPGRLRRV